jgi:hypothetical protein
MARVVSPGVVRRKKAKDPMRLSLLDEDMLPSNQVRYLLGVSVIVRGRWI